MRSVLCLLFLAPLLPAQTSFRLAPAVALEAEDFTIESGWKVVRNGEGNYMVDLVGFNHLSGERVLSLDASAKTGRAFTKVQVPQSGRYRLWVRYEYPPFCETRFRVVVEQAGQQIAAQVMGKRENLRYVGFSGKIEAKAQHDPSWGPEGLVEEVLSISDLKKGEATLSLLAEPQPLLPGISAHRNVDLLYLTQDVEDAWLKHYGKTTNYYPILDAFRDSLGPRWEVRFTNTSNQEGSFRISHAYNRVPWGVSDPASVPSLKPGASSPWIGLLGQDTAHFGAVLFHGTVAEFSVELRPVGSKEVLKKVSGPNPLRVYLPPYPGKGESPCTPEEAIDRVLTDLKQTIPPGKKPTKPLCYGGWMPLGQDNSYGRKYAELYVALGFRSLHPAHSGPAQRKNLQALGIKPEPSWMVMSYRNPPTRANLDRARGQLFREGLADLLRFYDYGDEIHFSEWLDILIQEEVARNKKATPREVLTQKWIEWLKTNRPSARLQDYWLKDWGPLTPTAFRPDSSAAAARENPRLYIDSLLFYEELALRFVAAGARDARATLGDNVLCGANYSCHPFYYPHSTMYIKWFREGAADLGRHSEYFWQLAQLGPMINGYLSEHFRSGMRDNPRAVLRQYTMPHAPGNTDANFLRSAFTHLAHGATMLDFFGIGMNETFTENHIDHRAVSRYRAIRDITHCVGFVEDLLPQARAVPSEVALLISESTERWDLAGIARDKAGHDLFGPNFRSTRLHFHLERLGIWKGLTFAGASPDLVTERDLIEGKLAGKKLLVLVGDHWPREMIPALQKWIQAGGVVLATAASGQRDSYGEPLKAWHQLAGLNEVKTEQRTTFLRPRQELPFLKPLDSLRWDEQRMPVLATRERIDPVEDVQVLGRFAADHRPAWVRRQLGKGVILYVAAHPGLAFLWSATQPPTVPDRGPNTHSIPTSWDAAANRLLAQALQQAKVTPLLSSGSTLIDARLLQSPTGFILPLANYDARLGQPVEVRVRLPRPIKSVHSAYHGKLDHSRDGNLVTFTLPKLGYGDILRLE